jgi:hypothetical protein
MASFIKTPRPIIIFKKYFSIFSPLEDGNKILERFWKDSFEGGDPTQVFHDRVCRKLF